MINKQLLNPESIVIVGGSRNLRKPGGKIIQNILSGGFSGELYSINPKYKNIQGKPCFGDINELPPTDLAILAIPAEYCKETMSRLIYEKNTRAFIVISAGFSEEGKEGRLLEKELADLANNTGTCMIGPNCIGVITPFYNGVFTSPVPHLSGKGCDFASGSGATAVFIMESAIPKGLTFSSIYSVGNSAQIGIEEILEYWDKSYAANTSSPVKLLYIENIRNPDKLLHHASSLIRKGCRIAAIKAGTTEAGSRAAASHTGAMVSSDAAVEALFRKAGIVRCFGREELTTAACVFMHKPLKGKNIAIITQAGGPAVMLTDALTAGGMNIPTIKGKDYDIIISIMDKGASAVNPIDMLATAKGEQLEKLIDYVDNSMPEIDSMAVIFGSNGMIDIREIYEILDKKIRQCSKPILPILPSISSEHEALDIFLSKGNINFPDEVVLGRALAKIYHTPHPAEEKIFTDDIDNEGIKRIIKKTANGFAPSETVNLLLKAAGIPVVNEKAASTKKSVKKMAKETGYPLVIKAAGPIHKSDVGGVTLNIKSEEHLLAEYSRMMRLKNVNAVILQPMVSGIELHIGAVYEPGFGHVIVCGPGGIFVEILGDYSSGLAPLTFDEALSMVNNIKSRRIIEGYRGNPGINKNKFVEIIVRLSTMLRYATEIKEIDLNPLIGNENDIRVVDARIRLEH